MAWKHSSVLGIATNLDPVLGGIVDHNVEGWFAIPQNDKIDMAEGFLSKQDAIDYIEQQARSLFDLGE